MAPLCPTASFIRPRPESLTSTSKTKERLLYLISPIGLLLLWQLLLMAGIGDRRFIPTPSDIAWRCWEMVKSGELAQHTAATLYRVFAGFLIGSVPGIAVGPAHGDVPPGPHLSSIR